MRKLMLALLAAAVAAVPLLADAAHRKPGLWQTTVDTKFSKGGPQIPSIPPEQLEKMKQMGIQMPSFTGPHTYKHCVTPEQAARDDNPETGNKSCQLVNAKWSGDTFSAEVQCTTPRGGVSHGIIKGTMSGGGTAFSGDVRVEGSEPAMGGDYAMTDHLEAKWLGADCGATK